MIKKLKIKRKNRILVEYINLGFSCKGGKDLMDEYIVGIDIGSSKVCSAAGKIDKHGRLQISGVTSVKCSGLKKGVVVDIDNVAGAVRNSVEQLSDMLDISIESAYISLSGGICELIPNSGIVAISSEDREISKRDVQRVLNAAKTISVPAGKEIIGVIPRQYIIDSYDNIKDPVGMSGVKLEVDSHVILAQTTVVSNLIKSINKAGINVDGIVLEPLAVSEAAMKKEEIKMGTALIDIGSEKIDISIHKRNDIVFTETIPLGGSTITNDISICLKIPFSEAEKLKIKYGSLVQADDVNEENIKVNISVNSSIDVNISLLKQIVEARVEEFLQIIEYKLKSSGFYEDVSGIVIVGGGIALFNGICDFAGQIFNKPVRIGTPEYVGASSPTHNTAVGIIKDVVNTANISEPHMNNKENYKTKQKNSFDDKHFSEDKGVFSKIKGFLADFF
ncbi:cell division protein FtsA [Clostridiales bacterium oral taxon 876 str. F0540]|nr:cell division protein FtsA [Clostridiales bacterium oral taxon 876 str. F0540]